MDTLSRGHFGTTCPEAVGSVPTPEHAAGMGQEAFSGKTATEIEKEEILLPDGRKVLRAKAEGSSFLVEK